MKSVEIKYFALFREKAGLETEILETQAQTYGDLYGAQASKYSFSLPRSMVQLAVNDEFARWSDEVQEGAHVVFIPPVAGG